jgi:hypothetical protein
MPYCQLNGMLDANYPKGALNYWKSNFVAELSDAAIAPMLECNRACRSKILASILAPKTSAGPDAPSVICRSALPEALPSAMLNVRPVNRAGNKVSTKEITAIEAA